MIKLKIDNEKKEELQEVLQKILRILKEKIVFHPIAIKCHNFARNAVLALYRKCLPYIAQISENSVLAGSLGFGLGVIISYWIFSLYYNNYYKYVIKSRTMSGVTFDAQHYGGLESLHLRSDLIVPRITRPNQVLVRIHAASVDLTDISILSGRVDNWHPGISRPEKNFPFLGK